MVKICSQYNTNNSRIQSRLWTHNRHPTARPHRWVWAMGCLLCAVWSTMSLRKPCHFPFLWNYGILTGGLKLIQVRNLRRPFWGKSQVTRGQKLFWHWRPPVITFWFHWLYSMSKYHKISNIRRTKYQNLNVSRLVLQLSLSYPMKLGVKSRMKM